MQSTAMPAINLCFPSNPQSPQEVDPRYAPDAQAFALLGAGILVWSPQTPDNPVKRVGDFQEHAGVPVAWRGQALDSTQYLAWVIALEKRIPRYTLAQYEMHRQMRHWVPAVKGFTPETWFVREAKDILPEMFPFHVKDGVSSAKAPDLPRPCKTLSDLSLHIAQLKRQRGPLTDGLVLRKHVDAHPHESRVWVFGRRKDDMLFQPTLEGPHIDHEWLQEVLANAGAPFFEAPFTMDVARAKDGRLLVMDMQDAGVSDYRVSMNDTVLENLRERWYNALRRYGPELVSPTPQAPLF